MDDHIRQSNCNTSSTKMGNQSSQRRNEGGPAFSADCQFTSDPHVPSPRKFDDFSSSKPRRNQQGPTFSGNCQFTSDPDVPPMPQTLRSSFPELIGMNAGEASGRIIQMGK